MEKDSSKFLLRTRDHNSVYNEKEVENLNSEAHRRYNAQGPQRVGESSVDLKEQTIFYDPNVPIEEMTVEHLWLGGSNPAKVLHEVVQRLVEAEKRIKKLEEELHKE